MLWELCWVFCCICFHSARRAGGLARRCHPRLSGLVFPAIMHQSPTGRLGMPRTGVIGVRFGELSPGMRLTRVEFRGWGVRSSEVFATSATLSEAQVGRGGPHAPHSKLPIDSGAGLDYKYGLVSAAVPSGSGVAGILCEGALHVVSLRWLARLLAQVACTHRRKSSQPGIFPS